MAVPYIASEGLPSPCQRFVAVVGVQSEAMPTERPFVGEVNLPVSSGRLTSDAGNRSILSMKASNIGRSTSPSSVKAQAVDPLTTTASKIFPPGAMVPGQAATPLRSMYAAAAGSGSSVPDGDRNTA